MWVTVQHTSRGRSHIKNGIPCQDKTFSLEKNGCVAIALADGAGSAKLSHFGAEKTTCCICEYLCDFFEDIFSSKSLAKQKALMIKAILKELNALSEELRCDIRDLASTLLAVVVKDDRYVLLHCGDGVSGHMCEDGLQVDSKPFKSGEFANQTVFVTSMRVTKTMRLIRGHLGSIRGFSLMSDGSGWCFYNSENSRLSPIVGRMIDDITYKPVDFVLEGIGTFFDKKVVNYKTNDDDSSIALLVKRDRSTTRYKTLSFEEKCDLFSISLGKTNTRQALNCAERIITELQTPQTLRELSKVLRIKEKHLKKKLQRLRERRCLTYEKGRFQSLILI